LIVEVTDEPPARGDVRRPRARGDTTGPSAGRRALAPNARPEVGLVERVGE
jgi:hypothetical protein